MTGRRGSVQTAGREDGQATIILLLALAGILGFMGLVIDVGWGLHQKRSAQNAADAAALAGIQEIATSNTGTATCTSATLNTAVNSLVSTYTNANVPGGTTATASKTFIDNNAATVADTSACSATGVQVTVNVAYSNFFLQIVGIGSASLTASASARIGALTGFSGGAPFVVCADEAQKYDSGTTTVVSLLDSTTSPPSLVESYIGLEFWLKGNEVKGTCGLGASWKGNAANDNTGCTSLPCDYPTTNGNRSGPVRVKVAGLLPGCDYSTSSDSDLIDCVMMLPLADGSTGSDAHVVTWAAFYVTWKDANSFRGRLLGAVFSQGPSTATWVAGQTGPLVLSLSE